MQIGETISQLRKQKQIKVEDLIAGCMTRSTYTRFVAGKIDTRASNLLTMLARLHVSFEEFDAMRSGLQGNLRDQWLSAMQTAVFARDVSKLDQITRQAKTRALQANDQTARDVACLSQLLTNQLQHQAYDPESLKILTDELMSVETWTHYELALFNNAMFAFSIDWLDLLVPRILKSLTQPRAVEKYGSEGFRILSNALMRYLDANDYQKAQALWQHLKAVPLSADMFFEQNLQLFWTGIMAVVAGDGTGRQAAEQSIQVCQLLGAGQQAAVESAYLAKVCQSI